MIKKVLVLDIDETLLNLEPLSFLEKFKKNYKEYEGAIIFDKYYISPRPDAKKFLESAEKHFELVAFSVADKELTREKLKKVGLLNYFSRIYGRESLIKGKKVLTKVSEDLNKDVNDIIIIDNEPHLIAEQNNVIGISSWFIGSDKGDNELMKVFDKLLKFNFAEIGS